MGEVTFSLPIKAQIYDNKHWVSYPFVLLNEAVCQDMTCNSLLVRKRLGLKAKINLHYIFCPEVWNYIIDNGRFQMTFDGRAYLW